MNKQSPSVISRGATLHEFRRREPCPCNPVFAGWWGASLLVFGLCASRLEVANAFVARQTANRTPVGITLLDAGFVWSAPTVGSVNSLGTIGIGQTNLHRSVTLLRPSIHGSTRSLICQSATWINPAKQLRITYAEDSIQIKITIAIELTATALQATIDGDRPLITSVELGSWAPDVNAKLIAVPYYTGSLWYLPEFTVYANAWWDWRTTHATALQGTAVRYLRRTDSTLSPLHEHLTMIFSSDVDAALPSPGNPASPYVGEMSGRLVLDIWSRDFRQIQQGFFDLRDYGITNCVGIIHIWQHRGYDNALPEHYPASEAMGGDVGLIAAMNAGKADGCLMALHENYVDYYRNYSHFDRSSVALSGDGTWMLSWRNDSTGIQSYSTKPSWMVKNASTQSPAIHARYGTTAAYLDVNSGVSPSSHGDMDAHAAGAGLLTAWCAGDAALWSYERKAHAGPVLGEGREHWYYSGLLDGVEAQFGAGVFLPNRVLERRCLSISTYCGFIRFRSITVWATTSDGRSPAKQ